MVTTRFRTPYLIAANTALLVWLLQFGACAFLRVYDSRVLPGRHAALAPEVAANYAHMSLEDREDLLAAMRVRRFRYDPVVGFIEKERSSKFVNVDRYGVRSNGPGSRTPAPMEGAIWFLGGSTTFGDGIADNETIPAQLERTLGRPVINLGVADFATAEENVLLNHYLRLGYRPSLALFMDGINENCGPDPYDTEMTKLFNRAQQDDNWDLGGPLVKGYHRAVRKARSLSGQPMDQDDGQGLACSRDGKQYPLSALHTRLLAERKAICDLYQITCRTMVQPFAGIHGPRDALYQEPLFAKELQELYAHLEPSWRAAGADFITDALDGYPKHPFIDRAHYSADACRVIAETIADRFALRTQ